MVWHRYNFKGDFRLCLKYVQHNPGFNEWIKSQTCRKNKCCLAVVVLRTSQTRKREQRADQFLDAWETPRETSFDSGKSLSQVIVYNNPSKIQAASEKRTKLVHWKTLVWSVIKNQLLWLRTFFDIRNLPKSRSTYWKLLSVLLLYHFLRLSTSSLPMSLDERLIPSAKLAKFLYPFDSIVESYLNYFF